jgi:hypothetical protein
VGLSALVPAWADKLRAAFNDPAQVREFGNTVAHVEQYLLTSGKYGSMRNGLSEEKMLKIREKATQIARRIYMLRAVGQATLPASPGVKWQMFDREGKLVETAVLQNDMSRFVKEEESGKIPSAVEKFIKVHGENAYGAMGPLSRAIGLRLPTTRAGAKWVQEHSSFKTKYPTVYGLFAPNKGKFDIEVYSQQITEGERVPIPNAVWLRMANDRIAYRQYSQLRDTLDESYGGSLPQDVRQELSAYRRQLQKEYPGFGEDFTPFGTRDKFNTLAELRRAATDREVRNSPVAKAAREYLDYRDAASAEYEASYGTPDGWDRSGRGAGLRSWLRSAQKEILGRYPEAQPLFEAMFAREVEK